MVGIITLSHQSSVRDELVNRVQPAALAAQSLETALVNQETGVRGYELAAIPSFLAPYRLGRAAGARALATAAPLVGRRHSGRAGAGDGQRRMRGIGRVASPAIAGVTPGHPHATATVDAVLGKRLFDQVRASLAVLQRDINARATTVKQSSTAPRGHR